MSFEVFVFLIILALAFDFMNGFHDAANSIATVVSTGVLKPYQAVAWAAMFNFVAIGIFHLKVAATVGKGIVDPDFVDYHVIFGALVGASDLAFRVLPLQTKVRVGLPAVAKVFDSLSDQTSYVRDPGGEQYNYIIERCSMCWGRSVERPGGFIAAGIIEEALRWISGGRTFRVDQVSCMGMGHANCTFQVYKDPTD